MMSFPPMQSSEGQAMQVIYERISPVTHGGAGNGNTYHFKVTVGRLVTVSTCERDVAYNFTCRGLPVPEELQGPYDTFGHPEPK